MDLHELINRASATLIDVRTPEEFHGGHVAGSTNIPMHDVPQRIEEFRGMSTPILLFCASGNRSGQVAEFLARHGFQEVYNAGGWQEVAFLKEQA
ncbi:MAG: rhodanese-like domain-containing protein [Flavobacteriales bacterium]